MPYRHLTRNTERRIVEAFRAQGKLPSAGGGGIWREWVYVCVTSGDGGWIFSRHTSDVLPFDSLVLSWMRFTRCSCSYMLQLQGTSLSMWPILG